MASLRTGWLSTAPDPHGACIRASAPSNRAMECVSLEITALPIGKRAGKFQNRGVCNFTEAGVRDRASWLDCLSSQQPDVCMSTQFGHSLCHDILSTSHKGG